MFVFYIDSLQLSYVYFFFNKLLTTFINKNIAQVFFTTF